MNTVLVRDSDHHPQSSCHQKPDGPHRLTDMQARPHVDSVLTDDDDYVRDVDAESSPAQNSAWYRKPRPERSPGVKPDLELAEEAEEKTRTICGCSRPTFIVIIFFLVVVAAAVAGGVAGAKAWRGSSSTPQSAAS